MNFKFSDSELNKIVPTFEEQFLYSLFATTILAIMNMTGFMTIPVYITALVVLMPIIIQAITLMWFIFYLPIILIKILNFAKMKSRNQ